MGANPLVLIVSDFAAAEFSSVIARHVQTKDIKKDDARIAFSNFDTVDGADGTACAHQCCRYQRSRSAPTPY